jgi:hypothetical protein
VTRLRKRRLPLVVLLLAVCAAVVVGLVTWQHLNRDTGPDDGERIVDGAIRLRPLPPDVDLRDAYVANAYTVLAAFIHVYGGHHVRLLRASYVADGPPVKVRPVLQWVPAAHDAVGSVRGDIERDYPDSRFVYRLSDVDLDRASNGGWYLLSQVVPQAVGTVHLTRVTVDLSVDGGPVRHISLRESFTLEVRHHGRDPQPSSRSDVDTGWTSSPVSHS